MGIYQRVPYVAGKAASVLQADRKADKTVDVRPELPGNIIVIHGVNDVGTGYDSVERGLCAGLSQRIGWNYVPAKYSMPQAEDMKKVEEDPDDVFFKRKSETKTFSPVIPFYWGFREEREKAGTVRGQRTDRYGNRLDKDLSKGGGPFANATSSLPDMWGKGKSQFFGLLDAAQKDATHPVLDNPGHLYMILAAKRLAALISMIRDYDENEAVTLVAHSQGCMLSLLAQAFLLDAGLRPADTLILNNPPYSLVDDIPWTTDMVEGGSGEDAAMRDQYARLNGRQTMHARLQTLVNIVHGVVGKKHNTPPFAKLGDPRENKGMVSAKWKASADRDNRGKVYLYFCPEDMTVALSNVQGIGWQGIPDFIEGSQVKSVELEVHDSETLGTWKPGVTENKAVKVIRQPMKELTARNTSGANSAGFFQRVFTNKLRPDPRTGAPVLVGQAAAHDFVLRAKGEDDQAHTATSDSVASKYGIRARLPEEAKPWFGAAKPEQARLHIRTINGEALPVPVKASLVEGAFTDAAGRAGGMEGIDPIDAAIAVTSDYGVSGKLWQLYPYSPKRSGPPLRDRVRASPAPATYAGNVIAVNEDIPSINEKINQGKSEVESCTVTVAYECLGTNASDLRSTGHVLIHRTESTNEARLRWQQTRAPRSFHGGIFGGAENHRQVTAYDVAIGGGKAAADPLFSQYLCAVADWRIKKEEKPRASILPWSTFVDYFKIFWDVEPRWRRALIEGNADYYSFGRMPREIPALREGLPSTVVCETVRDYSVGSTSTPPGKHAPGNPPKPRGRP